MTNKKSDRKKHGVVVETVARGSAFYAGGVHKGDRIIAINGEPIYNELDFQFFSADYVLVIELLRSGCTRTLIVEREAGQFSGVTLDETPIQRCANRCIFCFIDQMPHGLRKSLYVKDEDVRLSLLNGNYVTMSNFKQADLGQIVRIGLSPLYISVHATDPAIRRTMLGNSNAADILGQLQFLAAHGIKFHTQIVVCPGYNDGKILKKTITDLLAFKNALASIAVVPVGLTKYSNPRLSQISKINASGICLMVGVLSDRAFRRSGERKVFLADEFLIKAGLEIPPSEYYEDYPQIGNGVGLVRQLLDEKKTAQRERRPVTASKRRLIITAESAHLYIVQKLGSICTKKQLAATDVIAVHNRFFGSTVTVTGLLTAVDSISAVKKKVRFRQIDEIVLPSVMFNYAGYTLDGFSRYRIERQLGIPVRIVQNIHEVYYE